MRQIPPSKQHRLSHELRNLPATPSNERLLPLPAVESITGFKSSFIYQLIKEGKFPKPVKIGAASRWRESEVQQWIHDQIGNSSSGKCSGA